MNQQQGTAEAMPEVRFIQDDPAAHDFFGPHSKTADAIAAAIVQNPSLRTVGLLGPWGSGKSTVVRHLDDALATSPADASGVRRDAHVFVFDAWLRHGEPVRRSFLEELLRFAAVRDLCADGQVREALDRVSGRLVISDTTETPRLSPGGTAILLSVAAGAILAREHAELLAIPGLGTVSTFVRQTLALGWLASLVPLLIPLATILAVMGSRLLRRHRKKRDASPAASIFGDTNKTPEEPILSLLMSTQHQSKRTRVSGNVSPTALEFGGVYWGILQAIHSKGARLIIVVDNLDRIPAADAREHWAMLRTFFMADGPGIGPQVPAPVVVVPVARRSIDSIHSKAGDSEAGEGFLQKTFDVVFHLPAPVFVDWQRYLARQMKSAFGTFATVDRIHAVTFLADEAFSRHEDAITPRRINSFVNLLGSYRLLRAGDGIPFETMAYYCLGKEDIDNTILFKTRESNPSLDVKDPQWARHLAALHFGVKPAEAFLVMLDQPLREAIEGRKGGEFASLMRFEGAHTLLLREISTVSAPGQVAQRTALSFVTLACSIAYDGHERLIDLHQRLIRLMSLTVAWPTLTGDDVKILQQFVDVLGIKLRKQAIDVIEERLSLSAFEPMVVVTEFREFWQWAAQSYPSDLERLAAIRVPGSGGTFIDLMVACKDFPLLLATLQPLNGFDDVMLALGGGLNPGVPSDPERLETQIRALASLDRELSWAAPLGQAFTRFATTVQRVRAGSISDIAGIGPAVLVFAVALPLEPSVRPWLLAHAETKGVPELMRAALQARNVQAAGQLLGLLLALGEPFNLPPVHPGNVFDATNMDAFVDALDEVLRLGLTLAQKALPLEALYPSTDDSGAIDVPRVLAVLAARRRKQEAETAIAPAPGVPHPSGAHTP